MPPGLSLGAPEVPQLNAYQVMTASVTAHAGPGSPDPAVGAGLIDPLAALTWKVPDQSAPKPPASQVITLQRRLHRRMIDRPNSGCRGCWAVSRWPPWR